MVQVVGGWATLAAQFAVGMSPREIELMRPAFDNSQVHRAQSILAAENTHMRSKW
jgi:hypothetical protein